MGDRPLYREIGALHERIHGAMIRFLGLEEVDDARRESERAAILKLSQTLLRKLWSLTDSPPSSFGDDAP
jgi:hypothetical protein